MQEKHSYLAKFLYGKLSPRIHFIANMLGLFSAFYWLYYTLFYKEFFSAYFSGKLTLIDLLVGFPLILSLAPVLYALVYWLIKWGVIFLIPDKITVADFKDDDH